jgi:anti-sigma B factor antagonist
VRKIVIGWTSSRGARVLVRPLRTAHRVCHCHIGRFWKERGVGHHVDGKWSSLEGSVLGVEISSDTICSEVRLSGELDITTADRLEAALDQLIRSGYRYVVLDLAELDFLAASGLRVLIHTDTALHTAGGRLTLTNLPRIVRRVLAITALDTTLTID